MCNHGMVMLQVYVIMSVSVFLSEVGIGLAAYGQEVQASKSSSSSHVKEVSSTYGLVAGFKPEYYETSGQYLLQSLDLSFSLPSKVSLSVSSAVISVNEPERESKLQDTSISLAKADLLRTKFIKASGQVTHNLPTSEQSKLQGLQSTDAMGLSISTSISKVTLGTSLGAKKYWYQETLNADGQSNRDYDMSGKLFLSLGLGKLTSKISGALISRTFHSGRNDGLYEVSLSLTYSALDKLAVFAGIDTSEAQIVDQKRQQAKIYAKDLTAAYIGMSYQFLSGRG